MKIGVIGTPGKWSSEHLADEVQRLTGFRLLVDMNDVCFDLSKSECRVGNVVLNELDALIVKKISPRYSHYSLDRIDLLDVLQSQNVRIFSKPECLNKAVNRLTCTLELSKGGIPIPETVITENAEEAASMVNRFECAVFKPLFTSKARGMRVICANEDVREKILAYKAEHPILYIQKFVETYGRDYGLVFLGGNYLSAYSRVKQQGSWNTTTRSGGKYQPYSPPDDYIELAKCAQDLFGLDFTCVDVAETENGPVVFEVSAFGGFHGLRDTSGIDGATLYAEYVVNQLSEK